MSAFAIVALGMALLALVIVIASAIPLIPRLMEMRKRRTAIDDHPTRRAFVDIQALSARLGDVQPRLDEIRVRMEHMKATTGGLLESSAILRLNVDRISFATRLLLKTFVPTLQGSMADETGR